MECGQQRPEVQMWSNAFAPMLCFCVSFTWQMVKTQVIRFHAVEGLSMHDQIAFCAFHSFLVKVQRMLATYMYVQRMRNNNLEIFRTAGSSCPLQYY